MIDGRTSPSLALQKGSKASLKTNISPPKALIEDDFFPRWDTLVPWRVTF